MSANATTLKDLLNARWLEHNDPGIKLLSECFEFDELELRLLGVAPDSETRRELRNGLAKLVEIGGADSSVYIALANELEARRHRERDMNRCRRFGLAVQAAIQSTLETYGLQVSLVDRGFDFEIANPTDDVLEIAATRFEVGPYLLEVKATTTGQARMTPLQAETASQESSRYVLCVVDLRGFSEEDLDAEWSPDRVEPLAKIVPEIGVRVKDTYTLVEAARTRSVAIRNESALRYEVPVTVWNTGVTIADWVRTTFSGHP